MTDLIGSVTAVLDHGFVRVVDLMGDDAAIVQAARISYGGGTKGRRADRDLIRYLMRHRHTSPFEMCVIKLHVRLPIIVARQWIRHRTGAFNEISARYTELADEFYIPPVERLRLQSTTNRQGSGSPLPRDQAQAIHDTLAAHATRAYADYQTLLSVGLARELARNELSGSVYTEWYWRTDLHNLFHFLLLRDEAHAQEEIRAYARAIAAIVADWVPDAYEAWVDYQRDALTFSRLELETLRTVLATGQPPERGTLGLGEWKEFCVKFARLTDGEESDVP